MKPIRTARWPGASTAFWRTAGWVGCALVVVACALSPWSAAAASKAEAALEAGQVDVATGLLQAALKANPRDAPAELLLCRVHYSIGHAEAAVDACQEASSLAPGDSSTELWLGRALGMKAARANPFAAFGLAKRVRAAFEQAVALDPRSATAMNDLGEFYVNAPGVVGGGLDRATALAARMQAVAPAGAARLRATIAEKKNDLGAAEAEFKRAVALGATPQNYVDLGFFYQRHERFEEMEAALKQAIALDRIHDAALVDVASILTSAGRAPELAGDLLRQYLGSSARSEAAPAARVEVQLGRLEEKAGEVAAARLDYQAALALASEYAPAQKALEALR